MIEQLLAPLSIQCLCQLSSCTMQFMILMLASWCVETKLVQLEGHVYAWIDAQSGKPHSQQETALNHRCNPIRLTSTPHVLICNAHSLHVCKFASLKMLDASAMSSSLLARPILHRLCLCGMLDHFEIVDITLPQMHPTGSHDSPHGFTGPRPYYGRSATRSYQMNPATGHY